MKIYSMKGLAEKEAVTHDYLRVVIKKFKAKKIEYWREYGFFGIDGKCWFAYPKNEDIEFFDGSLGELEKNAGKHSAELPDDSLT